MSNEQSSIRSWQEIAAEAAQEMNREKLLKLSEELARALEERDKKLGPLDESRTGQKPA